MARHRKRATLVLLRQGQRVVAVMTTQGHPTWGQLKALKALSDGRLPLLREDGPPCFFTRVAQTVTVVLPTRRPPLRLCKRFSFTPDIVPSYLKR